MAKRVVERGITGLTNTYNVAIITIRVGVSYAKTNTDRGQGMYRVP